ncbi:hypothetical protein BH20ACT13_BH20ACT13_17490 [soil metagenome]
MKLNRMHVFAATVGVVVIGTLAAVALGEPGSGVTAPTPVPGVNTVTANFDHTVHLNSDKVKFQTKGPTDVRVQKLVFAAGSRSGWHHQPGIVLVAVESGAVTLWQSDCSSTTYGPGLPDGAVFAEGGDDPVQATSTNGAMSYVTLVAPNGAGFRIEDDPIACG